MIYKIVKAEYSDELEDKVNKHIKAGWEPIGGIVGSIGNFMQSMIKKGMVDHLRDSV